MLLGLPKDVLTYILSIVVYEVYVEKYGAAWRGVGVNVQTITQFGGDFERRYENSQMASFLKVLCLVHPVVKQLLRKTTRPYDQLWSFKREFFQTLLDGENK